MNLDTFLAAQLWLYPLNEDAWPTAENKITSARRCEEILSGARCSFLPPDIHISTDRLEVRQPRVDGEERPLRFNAHISKSMLGKRVTQSRPHVQYEKTREGGGGGVNGVLGGERQTIHEESNGPDLVGGIVQGGTGVTTLQSVFGNSEFDLDIAIARESNGQGTAQRPDAGASAAASTSDQSRSALLLRIHGAVYEAEYPLIQSIAYPKGYPDRDQSSYSNTTSAGEKQQTSGSHGKCMESPLPVAAATDVSRNTGTKATDRASSDAGNFERNLPAKLTCRDEGERNNGVDGNDQPSRGQAHAAAAGTRSEERPSIQTGSRKRKFGDVSIRSMEERPTLAALAAQGAPSSSRLYRGSPHRHGADNSLTREYEHNGVQEVNPDRCEHRANNSGSRAEEASDRGATKIRRNYATTSGEGRSHRGVGGDDCAEVPFCSLLFPSILLKFWLPLDGETSAVKARRRAVDNLRAVIIEMLRGLAPTTRTYRLASDSSRGELDALVKSALIEARDGDGKFSKRRVAWDEFVYGSHMMLLELPRRRESDRDPKRSASQRRPAGARHRLGREDKQSCSAGVSAPVTSSCAPASEEHVQSNSYHHASKSLVLTSLAEHFSQTSLPTPVRSAVLWQLEAEESRASAAVENALDRAFPLDLSEEPNRRSRVDITRELEASCRRLRAAKEALVPLALLPASDVFYDSDHDAST